MNDLNKNPVQSPSVANPGDHARPTAASKWIPLVASLLLAIGALISVTQLIANAMSRDSWLDEGMYLMYGWWYVTGRATPYSESNHTNYMPLFFYLMGYVQNIFGIGYLAGRFLSIACTAGIFALAFLIPRRITGSFVAGTAAVLILAGQYPSFIYYATATPYAISAMLSLLIIWILLFERLDRRIVYAVTGGLLYVLFFMRPNMLPFAMVPALWLLAFEHWRRWATLGGAALAGFAIPSIITIAIFGPKLFDVIMHTNGIAGLTEALGIYSTDLHKIRDITQSPMDPHGQWGEILRTARLYFLNPYWFLIVTFMAAVAGRVATAYVHAAERRATPFDIIASYVAVAAALHFFLSQSYCIPCIMPYTNYFMPVGAVACGLMVGRMVGAGSGHARRSLYLLGAILVGAIMAQATAGSRSLLATVGSQPNTKVAQHLAEQLRHLLPKDEPVLALTTRPPVVQAVWLADRVIEPRTVILISSYREFSNAVSDQTKMRLQRVLEFSGYWNRETMLRFLTDRYNVVIVSREANYSEPLSRFIAKPGDIPFADVIAQHFERIGGVESGGLKADVHLRKK